MRIALLTYSTRPRGGVVHTLALAEALARDGQDVTVLAIGRDGDGAFFRPVDPRVRVSLAPVPDVEGETVGDRVARSIAALRAHVDVDAFDVVHAQDCISANAVRGRCVRTVHHVDHFTTPQLVACHEAAIREPHTHVCVSAAVADELAAGWGITATVIPNGVESERFAAAAGDGAVAAADRAAWHDRLGRRWVLAVGGIEPRKGTLDLVRAMAALRTTHGIDVPLVVAGGETLFDYRDYRAAVDAEAVRLGVHPVVLGPVDHGALPALVAASAAFAFPSTKEGWGLAAMEALAAGVGVVCRDLPVLREVFGEAVRYGEDPATLATALADVLGGGTDPAPGRVLASRHRWDDVARRHLQVYAGLVGARPVTHRTIHMDT